MAELGEKRVIGAVALDVARNWKIVKLALEPIENVQRRINEDVEAVRADEGAKPGDKQAAIRKLAAEFDEVLEREMEIGYWPIPYKEIEKTLGECAIRTTAVLMFMIVTGETGNEPA